MVDGTARHSILDLLFFAYGVMTWASFLVFSFLHGVSEQEQNSSGSVGAKCWSLRAGSEDCSFGIGCDAMRWDGLGVFFYTSRLSSWPQTADVRMLTAFLLAIGADRLTER